MKPLSLGNTLRVLSTWHQLSFEGHRSQRAPGHGQLWVTTEGHWSPKQESSGHHGTKKLLPLPHEPMLGL